jgi:sporulation integral membrane protein YtvI
MNPLTLLIWLAVLGAAGSFILPHALPILLALITAVLLEPVVKALQKSLRIKRVYAVLLTFTAFLLVGGGLLFFVTTRIVIEVVELSQWLPDTIMSLSEPVRQRVYEWQTYVAQLEPSTASGIQSAINGLLTKMNSVTITLLNAIVAMIKGLPNFLVISVVYVIALFLFALDLPVLVHKFLGLFEGDTQRKMRLVLENLNRAIIGFLQAQVLISFLTYDLVLVGLWILGVPYALAVALIVVVVDVLPVLGTGAVFLPWAIYAFATGSQSLGSGLLVLYVVVMVFRRIIEPKILGNSLGISALATLISMYLGFMIFGVAGLIAGPALVILWQACRDAGFFSFRIRL